MRITGGFLKNQTIKVPKTNRTRPTSEKLRQLVFNVIQFHIEGASILDLFAGSGAIGIEALSRGAELAVFIEKDRDVLKVLKENLNHLKLVNFSTVLAGNVLERVETLKRTSFDLIYIDPPYKEPFQDHLLTRIDHLKLLKKGGILFLEQGAKPLFELPLFKTFFLSKTRKSGSSLLYQFEGLS